MSIDHCTTTHKHIITNVVPQLGVPTVVTIWFNDEEVYRKTLSVSCAESGWAQQWAYNANSQQVAVLFAADDTVSSSYRTYSTGT